MRYAKLITHPVPQSAPLDDRQVKNNAGGYVFALDDWARLERFLILGSDSSTYYQDAKKLTRENAKCVERCWAADPAVTVAKIVAVSESGRAPKNDPAIFALALGAVNKDPRVRVYALSGLRKVCRTGTHLFDFVDTARKLGRGWGRGLKRAVAKWYDERPVDSLAYQVVKYRERSGYNHNRLLDLSRPSGDKSPSRELLYRWICGKVKPEDDAQAMPRIILAHEAAMKSKGDSKLVRGILQQQMLPWEAIPTEVLGDPDIWRTLLPEMGVTALIRNLGRMTTNGVLKPLTKEARMVVERLRDDGELRKARIHPFNVLVARAQYESGQADNARTRFMRREAGKAMATWTPVQQIVGALEDAFYKSFTHVEPTGKRTLIGLDVSGSMSSPLLNSPLEVCAGAAAMAMVTMRAEENWHVMAFHHGLTDLRLTANDSLEAVLRKTRNVNAGGTDCSLPMRYAIDHKLPVDTFQVYTDNETWEGREHPVVSLQRYRQATGIDAKLIVVGMTSTGFSIADPNDAGMLDVVGFDSDAPAVMADFARH